MKNLYFDKFPNMFKISGLKRLLDKSYLPSREVFRLLYTSSDHCVCLDSTVFGAGSEFCEQSGVYMYNGRMTKQHF